MSLSTSAGFSDGILTPSAHPRATIAPLERQSQATPPRATRSRGDRLAEPGEPTSRSIRIVALVLTDLPESGLITLPDLAESIDAVPWDVLVVCRKLVEQGAVREGFGTQ